VHYRTAAPLDQTTEGLRQAGHHFHATLVTEMMDRESLLKVALCVELITRNQQVTPKTPATY